MLKQTRRGEASTEPGWKTELSIVMKVCKLEEYQMFLLYEKGE